MTVVLSMLVSVVVNIQYVKKIKLSDDGVRYSELLGFGIFSIVRNSK
jgi:hypothetical protein